MNKEQLKTDLRKLAEKHNVGDFILVFSYTRQQGQVLDEIEIASISAVQETGPCKAIFQWLRRQIILKLKQ